jgi:hypothetical protein
VIGLERVEERMERESFGRQRAWLGAQGNIVVRIYWMRVLSLLGKELEGDDQLQILGNGELASVGIE